MTNNNLRVARQQRGLTQWDLVVKSNVSLGIVSAIERNGYRSTLRTRQKIADALSTSVAEIWPDEPGAGADANANALSSKAH